MSQKILWSKIKQVLLILIIVSLIAIIVCTLFGWQDSLKKFFLTIFANALAVTITLITISLLYGASNRKWKRKNEIDGISDYKTLQCGIGGYTPSVMGFLMVLILAIIILPDYQEFLKSLQKGELTFEIRFTTCVFVYSIVNLLYVNTKKVFYNRYTIKIVHFLIPASVISWTEIQKIDILTKYNNECTVILTLSGKSYKFRSKTFMDGWEDFMEQILQCSENFQIPVTRSHKNLFDLK